MGPNPEAPPGPRRAQRHQRHRPPLCSQSPPNRSAPPKQKRCVRGCGPTATDHYPGVQRPWQCHGQHQRRSPQQPSGAQPFLCSTPVHHENSWAEPQALGLEAMKNEGMARYAVLNNQLVHGAGDLSAQSRMPAPHHHFIKRKWKRPMRAESNSPQEHAKPTNRKVSKD